MDFSRLDPKQLQAGRGAAARQRAALPLGNFLAAAKEDVARWGPVANAAKELQDQPCPICFELLTNPVAADRAVPLLLDGANVPWALQCGHVFHRDCLYSLQRAAGTTREVLCPSCRTPVRPLVPSSSMDKEQENGEKLRFSGYWDGTIDTFRLVDTEGGVLQQLLTKRLRSGDTEFFVGEPGHERKVSRESEDGQGTMYFEGPPGEERLNEIRYANGEREGYGGPRDKPALRWRLTSDGHRVTYEGPAGHEAMRMVQTPDGRRIFYKGPQRREILQYTEFWEMEPSGGGGPRLIYREDA